MKNSFIDKFKKWYSGESSIDSIMSRDETKRKSHDDAEQKVNNSIRIIHSLEEKELKFSLVQYRVFSIVFCLIFAAILIGTVNFLPGFADENSPTVNEVSEHYVEQGRDQTGATNTVAGMILDYRAFDTLGESFVLFTATCAVLLIMERKKSKKLSEGFIYTSDIIVSTVVKLIIPVIFVFGAYILVNGHLSPGGGFSGGSVLGAGLILYAMAFGEQAASRVMTAKRIRIVTIISLSFYCIAKSYSFFTGNEFNSVDSVISAGTPGDILSGGLILPLNIAVGLVVCCTMYSFYMLFRRGKID